MKNLILTIALLACLLGTGCSSGWEAESKAEPPKDLAEYLMPSPDIQKYIHGDSERTRVLFNLLFALEAGQDHETRIEALESEIAGLKRDPE